MSAIEKKYALRARLDAKLKFLRCRHESMKALLGPEEEVDVEGAGDEDCSEVRQQIAHHMASEQSIRVALGKEFKAPCSTAVHTGQQERQKQEQTSISVDRLSLAGSSSLAVPHQVTVRGKARKGLPGRPCTSCQQFYKAAGLSEQEASEVCRHKAKFTPVKSPKGYWDVRLPSTPEMLARQTAPFSPEKISPPRKVVRRKFNFN
ncbi:hypothetical protein ONE63_005071 [Megalurothrips usitatus]|uniref:DNA endonuclease activator Ctp1 C-terminal domain-containing protein n=1 Tax=Megalurothrips usitatus TaxID=439358 RepID=A0AAV7X1P5_9NEOP|nr:hypothetical protein ONE63_005071 [Megalurothrips usitatus]